MDGFWCCDVVSLLLISVSYAIWCHLAVYSFVLLLLWVDILLRVGFYFLLNAKIVGDHIYHCFLIYVAPETAPLHVSIVVV